MSNPNIVIREMIPSDYNFILSSWLKSYKFGSYFCKRIRDKVFYKYHHSVCERILARPTTKVVIAADPVDPTAIFGYAVLESFPSDSKMIVQYVYIKSSFRGMGVAKSLLASQNIELNQCYFTHWTSAVDPIIQKYSEMTYIPYLI